MRRHAYQEHDTLSKGSKDLAKEAAAAASFRSPTGKERTKVSLAGDKIGSAKKQLLSSRSKALQEDSLRHSSAGPPSSKKTGSKQFTHEPIPEASAQENDFIANMEGRMMAQRAGALVHVDLAPSRATDKPSENTQKISNIDKVKDKSTRSKDSREPTALNQGQMPVIAATVRSSK